MMVGSASCCCCCGERQGHCCWSEGGISRITAVLDVADNAAVNVAAAAAVDKGKVAGAKVR